MSGEVVAWRNRVGDRWHYCERDPREVHDNGKQTDALVLATDYEELSERLSDCEVELGGETAQREVYTEYTVTHDGVLLYCSSGMRDAYAALQAKLDAVTKDALALQGRAQRAESLLRECLEPLVWASNEAYGEFNDFERADDYEFIRQRIDHALTDQGRAGEGRNGER